MFGKGKKIYSAEYKEKLVAQIAHYEGRIKEALNKPMKSTYQDESSDDDSCPANPYKLNSRQSGYALRQAEASLSDRASMTLELAMLTIMQSEANVMVTPPELRKPVREEGTWLEVAAECKIDLVSFTITFYAHKPHRRFAPVRYRNVLVQLVKPAHEKELAESVLPKLNRPYLAIQVLQSYATAFRSRRTTLLELAEKYGDKLRMEAMPSGGYRVRFLGLLQVDWTLENMWSPIVPFCHRMKFEIEYMPKDYIHSISKLYKQFKEPSLETAERTIVLSRIFDICLRAHAAGGGTGSDQSDTHSAGPLHERRTTIDQEPEVPNVEHSPQKPNGKENKAQNKKTSMAPPKTIPKKAKKVVSKPSDKNAIENQKVIKNFENDSDVVEANNDKDDVAEKRKGVKRPIEDDGKNVKKSNASMENIKGNKGTENDIEEQNENEAVVENQKASKKVVENFDDAKKSKAKTAENRKGVKRAVDNDGNNEAKKSKTDGVKITSKSKPGLKGGKNAIEDGATESNDLKTNNNRDTAKLKVDNGGSSKSSKSNAQNKKSDNVAPNTKVSEKSKKISVEDNVIKQGEDKTSVKSKSSADSTKASKKKETAKIVDSAIDENNAQTQAEKKVTQKTKDKENNAVVPKDRNRENDVIKSKKAEIPGNNKKDVKKGITKIDDDIAAGSKKDGKTISKDKTVKGDDKNIATSKDKHSTNIKNVNDKQNNKQVGSSTVPKDGDTRGEVVTNNNKGDSQKKEMAIVVKEANSGGKLKGQVIDKTKSLDKVMKPAQKDNTVNAKEVVIKVASKKSNIEITKNNEKISKVKGTAKVSVETKVIKRKTTENVDSNKETANRTEKTINSKSAKLNSDNVIKNKTAVEKVSTINPQKIVNKDIMTKKSNIKPDNIKNRDKINDQKQQKSNTEINKMKVPENSTGKVLKETNRDETIQKVVEKNKIRILSNVTIKKADLNTTITKSKSIPMSEIKPEMQIKLADKLKTKIPMLKSKMKFSALNERVLPSNLKMSKGVEKAKIQQKSLPVFKKVVKNFPTRLSPRKLPSTFKPSSHGFSNK